MASRMALRVALRHRTVRPSACASGLYIHGQRRALATSQVRFSTFGDASDELANAPKNFEGAVKLYDDWAATYDKSLTDWGYEAPAKTAEFLKKYLELQPGQKKVTIQDCGCGTGISGQELQAVFQGTGVEVSIVGTDASPKSLEFVKETKPGVYSDMKVVNLELPHAEQGFEVNGTYDAVTCVGVTSYIRDFTNLMNDWSSMVRPGGVVAWTHRPELWDVDEAKCASVAQKLVDEKKWELVFKSEPLPYYPKNPKPEDASRTIYYLVYRRL